MTLTLIPRDGGTDLTMEQSGFLNQEARDRHDHGWQSSLSSLGAALEGKAKPTTPAPTILGNYRSSYVRSARMAFEEKGIAYAVQPAQPQSPEILALNPFGKMPAFRCGDLTLYETSAIMRHLDETLPGPALMPSAAGERAKAEQWISVLNCYGYPALVRNYVLQYAFPRGPDGQPDRATIDAALPEIRKVLGSLDRAIGPRDHLVSAIYPRCLDILLTPMIVSVSAMLRRGEGRAGWFSGRAPSRGEIGAAPELCRRRACRPPPENEGWSAMLVPTRGMGGSSGATRSVTR